MRYKIHINVAQNGIHYLGLVLREDTITPEKADQVLDALKTQFKEEEGFKITFTMEPTGMFLTPRDGASVRDMYDFLNNPVNNPANQ